MSYKERVVVTGLGVVSPLGDDHTSFWGNIQKNMASYSKIELENSDGITKYIKVNKINNFNPDHYMNKKDSRKMDRFTQFAVAATKLAIDDSKLNIGVDVEPNRVGVIIGTQYGGLDTWERQMNILFDKGPKRVSPFFVPMVIANIATGQVSINFKATGPNTTPVSGFCSSSHAIGDAYKLIQEGSADVVICGGAEASISMPILKGYSDMGILSNSYDHKENESSLLKKNESEGMVMSEGAGILILESLNSALKRNANIYSEIIGYGQSGGFDLKTMQPYPTNLENSIKSALNDANISVNKVSEILSFKSGIPYLDKIEVESVKNLFNENTRFINKNKSIGHMMGASGAIDGIIMSLSIYKKELPFDRLSEKKDINIAITNSIDLSGQCVSLIYSKPKIN